MAGSSRRKLFFEVEKVSVALLFLLQEKGRLRKAPLGQPPGRITTFFRVLWVYRLIFLVFGYVHLDHICDFEKFLKNLGKRSFFLKGTR